MSRKQRNSKFAPVGVEGQPRVENTPAAIASPAPALDEPKSGRGHFVRHKYNERGELAE
jgi:hypothetical protein